ncbi:dihydrodipicolinate synthase family protein [Ignatzschineria sp. LJL83]
MKNKFTGAWCPSVTPFTKDNNIDYVGLEQHYKRLEKAGINGVLVMGSIGEFATLGLHERLELIEKARQLTTLPLIAHTSATHVPDIIQMSQKAKKYQYDAVMILPHYYYGQTATQILEYYLDIDKQIDIPWFIYNFPARTGCDVDAGLVVELAKRCRNFVGIKDTVDTLSHTRNIVLQVKSVRPDFSVLAGYDEYFAPNLLNGGSGVLSGLTNLIPEVFTNISKAFADNDLEAVMKNHQIISEMMSIYAIGNDFVTTIKTAVSQQYGYMEGHSRNYAGKLNEQELQLVDDMFKKNIH